MTTFKEWLKTKYNIEQLREMSSYGADAGWNGLVWNEEIVSLHDQYESELWEVVKEGAADSGFSTIGYIAQWEGSKGIEEIESLKTCIVWYVAERYATDISQETEENKEE
jgi:hypothetical protein